MSSTFAMIALVFEAGAVLLFGGWLLQTDFIFGHKKGPPEFLISAFVSACLGVAAFVGSFFRRGSAKDGPMRGGQLALRILNGILCLPCALILLVCFGELPRSLSQMHAQHKRSKILQKRSSVPELIQSLKDKNPHIRLLAVRELGKLGPRAKAAVPSLIELLKGNDMVSDMAASALGQIGPDASAAIPALAEMAKNPKRSSSEREWAVRALDRIDPEGRHKTIQFK